MEREVVRAGDLGGIVILSGVFFDGGFWGNDLVSYVGV